MPDHNQRIPSDINEGGTRLSHLQLVSIILFIEYAKILNQMKEISKRETIQAENSIRDLMM
jgi:hypothetical protein